MDFEYSVIIRTTGEAGEKYRKLLKSIEILNPKPCEVIVVIPEGYPLPEDQLGWETFYLSPKGMVIQRLFGIAQCKTPYALICDDDMCFGSDFVQKLHRPLAEGLGGLSIAPLYSFLPQPGVRAMLTILMGSALPTLFHRDRYVSVLRSTGYSYNRRLEANKYYETQSAAWTCFYADVDALRSIDFEAERVWLDSHGYAAMDDQTMFHKAWLQGVKTIVVADAEYEHLDARTSTRETREPVLFSRAYNRVVYWHRFVLSQERTRAGRAWAKVCFRYYCLMSSMYDILKRVPKQDRDIKANGRREAENYIRSDAYLALPPVK